MQDLMFKATDKAAWDAFALVSGLTVTDEDVTFVAPGILISEIGAIATTPPVFDAEGNMVTPSVMDEHHHVNVRVLSDAVDCEELSLGGTGVEWIDPATVSSPNRIWAGGMNYFTK